MFILLYNYFYFSNYGYGRQNALISIAEIFRASYLSSLKLWIFTIEEITTVTSLQKSFH